MIREGRGLHVSFSFGILILISTVVLGGLVYVLFFYNSSGNSGVEGLLRNIGFEDSSEPEEEDAVALPTANFGGGSGGASGSSGGVGGGLSGENNAGNNGGSGNSAGPILAFCTFDSNHFVVGQVPCRCGFGATCNSEGQLCDATFNNGFGV